MWIRTQENKYQKSELVNVFRIKIRRIIGDKDFKYALCGQFESNAGLFSGEFETYLGIYSKKEDAMAELDKIEEHISDNPNKVYKVK